MTDYPYEGDHLALIENITIPRIANESIHWLGRILGLPDGWDEPFIGVKEVA